MAQNSSTAVTNEPVIGKKKRGYKRLKGLITRKSFKGEKKSKSKSTSKSTNKKSLNNNASTTSSQDNDNNSVSDHVMPYIPDDASTVYGAELDASVMGRSLSSASLSTAKSTIFVDPVQVILLIMDPDTRRFELLQLEFDSNLARVSDIYNQISTAATEEVLQKASYKAVITPKGEELERDAKLSDHMTGAAVVIAVPDGTTESAQKCAQMAIPILTNSKVHKMLISSGIKPEDLPERPKKVKRSIKSAPTPSPATTSAPPVPTPTTTPATTSAPVEVPATPAKVTKPTKPAEQKVVDQPLKPIKETLVETTQVEKKTVEKTVVKEESPNTFVLGLLFAVFAHLFMKAHTNISSPLAPGSTLSVGRSRNSCGLLGSVPFKPCTPTTMTMGTNGVLKVFQGEEMVFSLIGKASCEESSDEDCVDGVVVEEDGTLLIGGEKAKAPKKASIEVTPWPFSEDVVYKSGIGNLF